LFIKLRKKEGDKKTKKKTGTRKGWNGSIKEVLILIGNGSPSRDE